MRQEESGLNYRFRERGVLYPTVNPPLREARTTAPQQGADTPGRDGSYALVDPENANAFSLHFSSRERYARSAPLNETATFQTTVTALRRPARLALPYCWGRQNCTDFAGISRQVSTYQIVSDERNAFVTVAAAFLKVRCKLLRLTTSPLSEGVRSQLYLARGRGTCVAEVIADLESYPQSKNFFVLFVQPSGITAFQEIRLSLELEAYDFGIDVISEADSIIP